MGRPVISVVLLVLQVLTLAVAYHIIMANAENHSQLKLGVICHGTIAVFFYVPARTPWRNPPRHLVILLFERRSKHRASLVKADVSWSRSVETYDECEQKAAIRKPIRRIWNDRWSGFCSMAKKVVRLQEVPRGPRGLRAKQQTNLDPTGASLDRVDLPGRHRLDRHLPKSDFPTGQNF